MVLIMARAGLTFGLSTSFSEKLSYHFKLKCREVKLSIATFELNLKIENNKLVFFFQIEFIITNSF
jgi:hypothetical protein